MPEIEPGRGDCQKDRALIHRGDRRSESDPTGGAGWIKRVWTFLLLLAFGLLSQDDTARRPTFRMGQTSLGTPSFIDTTSDVFP